jgi:hypothetical protein
MPDLNFSGIRCHVHKAQLKMHRAVKEVEERAPFLKDLRLILLLGELVVDILKLDGLCVDSPAQRCRSRPETSDQRECSAVWCAGMPSFALRFLYDFRNSFLILTLLRYSGT